jgi:hypothetical protein
VHVPAIARCSVFLLAGTLAAQSISITSPSSGEVWTGWTGREFTVSISDGASVVRVCYSVDAHSATNPGPPMVISGNSGALRAAGCSNSAPFDFPVNTFLWGDGGQHEVAATAYDSLGRAVATSSGVPFTIANTWPVSCAGKAPQWNVTASTAFTANWSGQVKLSAEMRGPCASDRSVVNIYIDGVLRAQSYTNGSITIPVDTTQFQNGPHQVGMTWLNDVHNSKYGGSVVNLAGEFSRTVTFANRAVPGEVRTNARTIYIAPGASFTLRPALINTDGSTASSVTFDFVSANPSVANVSPSRGSSTSVKALAQGAAKIYSMAEQKSGSDGVLLGHSQPSMFHSATLGNFPDYHWRLLRIVGGTNCIPGLYLIGAADVNNASYVLQDPVTRANTNFATAYPATCSWATGPTRVSWAQVNQVNAAIAHFSKTGSILNTYTPRSSMVLNEGFASMAEISSQPYPVPYLTSICQSGFNALEASGFDVEARGWQNFASQPAMASAAATWLKSQKALVGSAPCSLGIWFTGDNLMRALRDLYASSQGVTSARNGSTWPTSGIATLFQAYKDANAKGPPYLLGMTLVDEFAYGGTPLQGPTTLGGKSSKQNWLGASSSITASGGTCLVQASTLSPGGTWSMFQPGWGIIVTGSATPGMNTPVGGIYKVTGLGPDRFTFPCTRVANGVYNSLNDPGLRINTLNAGQWYQPPGGTSANDFTPDDALAYFKSQIDSIPGHIPTAPSIAGDTNAVQVSCVNGGTHSSCGQFLTENGQRIYTLGEFDDQYWTHAFECEVYLPAHSQLHGYISDIPTCSIEELPQLRSFYGSYDPARPMLTITQGTSMTFAYTSAQPPAVASCSGNTITFAEPHHITDFVAGWSRLWITGSSDAKCNSKFVILSAPTPTSITVAYAATQQVCTDRGPGSCAYHNGGLLTFANGDEFPLYQISADGNPYPMGLGETMIDYGTSAISKGNWCGGGGNSDFIRHRGQTFTLNGVSGPGSNYFNNRTFIYDIENLSEPIDGNGSTSACNNYFREIPVLNGKGGSASIVYDGGYVPGRNPGNIDTAGNTDPNQTFLSVFGAMLARAAGHRLYQFARNPTAYLDRVVAPSKAGWTGQDALTAASIYGQNEFWNQLAAHPNVEDYYSVPEWHAASEASRMWSRLGKYYLGATALNATDYGPLLESATFQSASGYLHIIGNYSNGTETRTIDLAPYETPRQNIVLWLADATHGIEPFIIVPAGTPTYRLTLLPGQAAYFLFPKIFAGELDQPRVALRLTDVPKAASIAANCGYDRYTLANAVPLRLGGGAGGIVAAALNMDRNIGPVYCTISYLGSSNQLLAGGAHGEVMTF